MDTFDVAFLVMQEKAADVPFKDCTCICLKSDKDIKAWGPEARLIGDIVVGAWKRKAKGFLSELRSCYDVEPELKINEKKINSLFKKYRNIGKDTWKAVEKKVRKLLEATTERSIEYFIDQAKKQKKSKKAEEEVFDPTIAYDAFIAEITGDHIASFMERYPDAILHPEIERLSHYLRVTDEAGPLEKYYVKERLDVIHSKGESYLEGMTDVEVGKAWTSTGVELAYRNNVAEYMIVAQVDDPNKPCPVCRAMHGKSFSVVQAKKNIDHLMTLKGTEDFAKENPFPRIGELRNLSREEFHARGDLPSFHSACRCDVVFSWGGEIPVAQRYKPEPPKAKILKFIPAKNKTEATKYAKEQLGMQQVDFGKLDMEVINEMNRTVTDMYDEYPAMKGELKFLGSAQSALEVDVQKDLAEAEKKWRLRGKELEEKRKNFLKENRQKFAGYAFSTKQEAGDYRGIAINEKWGGKGKWIKDAYYPEYTGWQKADVFKTKMKLDEKNRWVASGTGNIHGTVLHEFGHQIGFTLEKKDKIARNRLEEYRQDTDNRIYDLEKLKKGLSEYAWVGKHPKEEFVAECWAEYSVALEKGEKARKIANHTGNIMVEALIKLEGKK